MDDTIDDDAGIPFLQNGDDIPVHSTPIKGERVPLPSTRSVSKFCKQRTSTQIGETDSESIQSVQLSDVETKDQMIKGYETDYKHSLKFNKHTTPDTHKQFLPQPDKTLDISNQDNLRPKLRDCLHRPDLFRQENTKLNHSQKYLGEMQGIFSSSVAHSSSQYDKQQIFISQSKSSLHSYSPYNQDKVSSNNQLKSSLQNSPTNKNGNAFSSYRSYMKKDNKLSLTENDGVSCRVQVSSYKNAHENSTRDHKEFIPGKQRVQLDNVDKTRKGEREDSITDRNKVTFNSQMYSNRSNQQNSSFTELENTTIAKQRQEVQLLVSELKDRDRELSDMMSSHQQQLLAWEQDRLRLKSLERASHHLEVDLQNKSSQLQSAILTLKAVKSRESDNKVEIEKFKDAIDNLEYEKRKSMEEVEKYKIIHNDLHNQLENLSKKIGQLQAREAEFTAINKEKEKDLSYATQQMKELSSRLQQLDFRCKECQDREREALKEKEHWKSKYENSHTELQKMTEELDMKRNQCSRILEENRSARNQLSLLQKETDERESSKDGVIESMKVKQERTDKQLKNLRELYERQLKEVSELQMQLETSKDILQRRQSSMEQLHQSDRSSDLTPDQSGAKQRLTFSPQNRLSHNNKLTDPDSSQSHSSGYQSQLYDNQTGIASGSQTESKGPSSDFKNHQTRTQTVINNDNLVIGENQPNLNFPRTSSQIQHFDEYQSPRTSHEEYKSQTSDVTNKENKSHSFNENFDKDSSYRNDHQHSPTRENYRIKSLSPQRQSTTSSSLDSPTANKKIVIKRTSIQMYPTDSQENDKPSSSKTLHIDQIDTVSNGAVPDGGMSHDVSIGFEKEFVFENKLRSFLDEMDTDFDDSIWEDKPDRNQSLSTVDCSPSSKLQKLLLESRMMIDSLGKSADMSFQGSQVINDTLEKPNFDETNNGETRS